MLRLSKLTDYGIVLLAELARDEAAAPRGARELAETVDLPVPVVSKVLKMLARRSVLESQRGSKGGYSLSHRPSDLSVADIIGALEGPVALTECNLAPALCQHEDNCSVRGPWQVINHVVRQALSQMTLADLIDPQFSSAPTTLEILHEQCQ